MGRFIVTGSFQTQSGNIGSFRYEIDAADHGPAMDAARERLQRDKRKRYMGKLDMSCSPAPTA